MSIRIIKNFNTNNAELIGEITPLNFKYYLEEIRAPSKIDVNGGMIIKYACMGQIMKSGINGFIGNGNVNDSIYHSLVDNSAKGTYFIP